MIDFHSLQIKINDLKAKVSQNSISPTYLGSLLEDFLYVLKALDVTDLSEAVRTAVNNAQSAIATANQALIKSGDAESAAFEASKAVLTAINTASHALSMAQSASADAASAKATANALNSKIGQPNGIAPLDESGRIPARHIPGSYDDVLEFAGFRESVPEIKDGQGVVSLYRGVIYFCTPLSRFIYRVPLRNPYEGPMLTEDDVEYWNTWPNAEGWGEYDEKGHIPQGGKIYVDIHRNRSYRWSGTTLASLDDGVALGYTPQTAFPGNEGLAAAKAATEALSRLNEFDVLPFDGFHNTLAEAQEYQHVPGVISWIKAESAFYISSDEGWNVLKDEIYNTDMYPDRWIGMPTHVYSYRSQLYILRSVESPNPDLYNTWYELVDYNQHITDLVSSLNNRITRMEDDMENLHDKIVVLSDGETEIQANPGCFYRFDREVDYLHIDLESDISVLGENTTLKSIGFHFTTGSAPQVEFACGKEIEYHTGFAIEPNTTYEINTMWNGKRWVIAYATIE